MECCFIYKQSPIRSVQALCKALKISKTQLLSIAKRASSLYIGPLPIAKKNGEGTRYVYSTKPVLKNLLYNIKSVLLEKVDFPYYLNGSLTRRDIVTNASIHKKAKRIVIEDIATFFDSITEQHVFNIWRKFFKFSHDVSQTLTQLTTKDGHLCQGAPTSSYLANLIFWQIEPLIVRKMQEKNIRYSRYVDDITITTAGKMDEADKQWAIAQIYAMVGRLGLKIKRTKHTGATARTALTLMGLNINTERITRTKQYRSTVRAQVFQLEHGLKEKHAEEEIQKMINSASSRVGNLARFHKSEALRLKERLKKVKQQFREYSNSNNKETANNWSMLGNRMLIIKYPYIVHKNHPYRRSQACALIM